MLKSKLSVKTLFLILLSEDSKNFYSSLESAAWYEHIRLFLKNTNEMVHYLQVKIF